MVVYRDRSGLISPCLRVRPKHLSLRPPTSTSRHAEHPPPLNLRDPQTVAKQLRHMEYLGLPDTMRLNFVFRIRKMQEAKCSPLLILEYNTEVYARARAAVEHNCMMNRSKELDEARNIKRWKVQDFDPNAWRQNIIDHRMIYSGRDRLVTDAGSQLPSSRPSTPETELPRENSYLKVEKSYILDTKARVRSPLNLTAKRLMLQTIKRFHKPNASPEYKYCAPKTKLFIEEIVQQPPKFEVVTNFPMGVTRWARRHEGTICTHNSEQSLAQYCDVLGPYVCQKCIEVTNRRIIAEIQKEAFPDLEMSVTTLVAPKLARAMSKGENMLSRGCTREQTRAGAPSNASSNAITGDSSLKFPIVEKSPKDFMRAGIERSWYNRSKTFHYDDQGGHYRDRGGHYGGVSVSLPATPLAGPRSAGKRSAGKRKVTIGTVKSVHG